MITEPAVSLPPNILGTILEPDGTPGNQLQVEVLPPPTATTLAKPDRTSTIFGKTSAGSQVLATGLTDTVGNFSITLPRATLLPPGESLTMRVRGSSPSSSVILSAPPSLLGPLGYLGTFTLNQALQPIPAAIFDQLEQEISVSSGRSGPGEAPPEPTLPKISIGEDDCIKVLENQVSFEQYPYGVFFQLIAPNLYSETETLGRDQKQVYQNYVRIDTQTNRTQITGPISIDDFRQSLLRGPRIVGSLGLGYILRVAQNWSFQGLALGDLVYSLPLAPGEQQQIVIEEQITTLKVQETESVFGAETSVASAVTDSSTQAAFHSAFSQAAQGGSSYTTASETGAMTVGGGLLGILGGPSGSLGETISTGSSHNWMDGVQNYASSASQSVQTYAEQQSAAQRRATRTAMRMATASEATTVTTKTITNHNKLHALTMEYFEVLRLFDVSTTYDGVSLVCLVPLDIVWFLPPGQKEHLDDVITDSDLSNAIQFDSTLMNSSKSMAAQLQVAIPFASNPLLAVFAQITVSNVISQIGTALTQATSLLGILSGLGGGYATQVNEANQVKLQITQAQTLLNDFKSTKNPSDLTNALTLLTNTTNIASALFQQLSSPTISGSLTRQQVLDRYEGILAHADVLKVWLPSQYASGLSRLEKFAADPRATVVLDSLAEDVIQFSANASVLPFDHIYVAAVTRWGTRIGPVELITNPPVTVPGQFDVSNAFKTSQDLLQYLQGQRNPGNSNAGTLQASIALPMSLSPSDVVGFEITHSMDSFSYQLQTPLDAFVSFFGTNGSTWPGGVLGGINQIISPPIAPQSITYTRTQLAKEVGSPYLWNFRADLTASVTGNPESYIKPTSSAVELPTGVYPIPAIQVSPLLKYSDLIMIENMLQHVLRNVVRYSKAVWTWLTPEERVMLLEPYLVGLPGLPDSNVPLLDCVGNEVLGFYGNCMMMPFSIPQSLGDTEGWPITTGELEDSLLRFHRQGAPHTLTRVMMPTRGVLGEAMLGHCASGEKIDLTRFWNWQDSPADTAPAIAPVTVPGSQVPAVANAQAPNQLSGMLPTLVNNVNAPTISPTDALAQALAGKAPASSFPDLTGSSALATLLQATQNTANQARQDALSAQTSLTKDAIDQAAAVLQSALGGGGGKSSGTAKPGSSGSSSDNQQAMISALIPVLIQAAAAAGG